MTSRSKLRKFARRILPIVLPIVGAGLFTVGYIARAGSPPVAVPMLLGVQGYVTDSSGNPVTGAQNVTLALYTTDIGGTAVFSESQQVNFENGVMSTQLGRNAVLDPAVVVYPNAQLFVGVTIGTGTELAPRLRITSATYAIQAQHAVQADTAANGVPPGTIVAFGGTTPPAGWLLCDGSVIDPIAQSQYAPLRAAIGESWGDGGDGSSPKFHLPDFRGYFLRGLDTSPGALRDPDVATRTAQNGGNGGQAVGSRQNDALASHAHGVSDPGHTHDYYSEGDGCTGEKGLPRQAAGSCVYGHTSSASGTGISIVATGAAETRPRNVAVNYIVKF